MKMTIYPYESVDGWNHLDMEENVTNRVVVLHLDVNGDFERSYPWPVGKRLLCLGRITGMSTKGIFVDDAGHVRYGQLLKYFRVVPNDQL